MEPKTTAAKTTPNQCVVAVYESGSDAEEAVRTLRQSGLTGESHVSIVRRHLDPQGAIAAQLDQGDDSLREAAVGSALGGLTGVAGAATLFAVAGMGVVLMTGPLVVLTGAIVGALLGAMKGWGVHDQNIEEYESLVKDGKVLVVVAGEPLEVDKAQKVLKDTSANQVTMHARTASDSAEIDDRPTK